MFTAALSRPTTAGSSYCARAKKKLDNAHTVAYTINNRETTTSYMKDPFCRIYAKEISLRPSCYACPYCTPDKPFDFTLGDFWGIEKILPQLADGKGTSLVITGTQRACDIVEQLGPEAQVTQVPRQSILQPALLTPAKQTILRKLFMRDFAQKDSAGRCDIPLLLKKYGA